MCHGTSLHDVKNDTIQPILSRLFNRLRQSGFNLGVGEYRAALQAIEGGYGSSS
ncbi:MAG: hypothetical protein RLP02_13575 [Coleofasciculus sp. C2-GNP5-27]